MYAVKLATNDPPSHFDIGVGLAAEAEWGQQWYTSLSNPWYPTAISIKTCIQKENLLAIIIL
jgi:hypothetical protein